MSRINTLLHVTAAATTLALLAYAGPAVAGGAALTEVARPATLADKGDVVVTGPGGTRPKVVADDGNGTVVHGPGGGRPPVRPLLVPIADGGSGPIIIHGPGGTRPQVTDGDPDSGGEVKGMRPRNHRLSVLVADGGNGPIVRGPGGGTPPRA